MDFDWKIAYERVVSKVMDCLDLLEETVLNGEISSKAVHKIIKKLIQDEQNRTFELAKSQLQMESQSKSKCSSPAQNEEAKNFKHGTASRGKKSKNRKVKENLNVDSYQKIPIDIEIPDVENVVLDTDNSNDAESHNQTKEMGLKFQNEETKTERNRNFQPTESQTVGISDISLNSNPNQVEHQLEDEDENDQVQKDSQPNNPPTKKLLKCPKCTYRAKWRINVETHFKSVHVRQSPTDSETSRPFPCPESGCNPFVCPNESCEFRCKQQGNLTKHLKTVHNEERQYKCELCPFRGKTRDIVRKHLKNVHSDIRPFKCTERKCNFAFKTKGNLIRHLVTQKKEQDKNY